MRVNILETVISDKKLEDAASNFESREAMMPYLIMNSRTFNELEKSGSPDIKKDNTGDYEFCGWSILINNNLSFGDVDIR